MMLEKNSWGWYRKQIRLSIPSSSYSYTCCVQVYVFRLVWAAISTWCVIQHSAMCSIRNKLWSTTYSNKMHTQTVVKSVAQPGITKPIAGAYSGCTTHQLSLRVLHRGLGTTNPGLQCRTISGLASFNANQRLELCVNVWVGTPRT